MTTSNEHRDEPDIVQDLSQEAQFTGVYSIYLLFREKAPSLPSTAEFASKLEERLGGIDVVSPSDKVKMFALLDHCVEYENGQKAPSQLLITECNVKNEDLADPVARTQFWDVQNGTALFDTCPWQIMISDFMARGLHPHERADILADWVEIALELFPSCEAVYFQPSGKLLEAEQVRDNPYEGFLRFFYGGVNIRFFNVQDSDDSVVDSLGLYALGLPDVQYHFHDLEVNSVVNHATNVALYQFENDAPIESGHTVGGIDPNEQWKCRYEMSLIQPLREVLDVCAGNHAAGKREEADAL